MPHPRVPVVATLLSLSAALAEVGVQASEPLIYVSPTGNDASATPADPATPLRTLAKASTLAGPGTVIKLRGGTWRETGRVQIVGTSANPVVIEPYQSEKPVFSGADVVTGWTSVGGGIYEATLPGLINTALNQTDQVFVDGVMLHERDFIAISFYYK